MSGLFSTFNVAKQGMQVQQTAINTTSHNIANAATEGFSRQRVNLSTTLPNNLPGIGQVGTGVEIDSITRTRDIFLDAQVRYESSVQGKFESTNTVLEQVEIVFTEPSDTGLNAVMNEMWTSWQELSKSPESSNTRTVVAQNALTMAEAINHNVDQLNNIIDNTVALSESKAYDANTLLNQINNLNDQIYRAKIKGLIPNDLMDQRDLQIDQLADIICVKTEMNEFGSIQITSQETGDILLDANPESLPEVEISVIRSSVADGSGNFEITLAKNGDIGEMVTFISTTDYQEGDVVFVDPTSWSGTPVMTKPDLQEGQLSGQMEAIDTVENYQDMISDLACSLAEAINTVHSDGGIGIDFFVSSDGNPITAENITVNQNIVDDVELINAGYAVSSPEGDGSRALAIAQLRNGNFQMNDLTQYASNYDSATMTIDSATSGTTFDNFYKDIVAKVGIDAQSAERGVENQGNLLLQLEQRKESISGVSIDEEVANLVQCQTVYQANARVMSTIQEMLDTLLNRMGL
jgi:flagellar hook-associated protein 1 FlgK